MSAAVGVGRLADGLPLWVMIGLRVCAASAGAHRGRRQRLALLALEPQLDHVRAALVVVVELLAMHAVDALVDVDVALGVDRTAPGIPWRSAGRASRIRATASAIRTSGCVPGIASAAPSGQR